MLNATSIPPSARWTPLRMLDCLGAGNGENGAAVDLLPLARHAVLGAVILRLLPHGRVGVRLLRPVSRAVARRLYGRSERGDRIVPVRDVGFLLPLRRARAKGQDVDQGERQ